MMKSKRLAFSLNTASSLVTRKSSAPSASASSRLPGEWLSTVTCAPMAWPNLTAIWPSPPKPTTPKFVACLEPEMLQRRIGGDAGAEQRRRALERNALRDREDVILVDGDAGRIAAIGRRLLVLLVAVIGERHADLAILLLARAAGLAAAAGIDEAADADDMAGLPFLHMIADLDDAADDLVAGDHGKDRVVPLVLHLVNVRVADAAIENVDQHVVRTGLAPLDRPGHELRRRPSSPHRPES